MLSALDVARYIISLDDPDAGDLISNLKLQKLLYYCQGFSLVLLNKPIFNEAVVAWKHGPVVKSVYQKFKDAGSGALSLDKEVDYKKFSAKEAKLINDVYNTYGQFSAWRLREMTHNEMPWKSTNCNDEISHKKMKTFFLTLVNNN